MEKPAKFTFSNARSALAVRVRHGEELPTALHELGLRSGQPNLVLIGGASKMNVKELNGIRSLFVEGLVPAMQLMGQARAITGETFPLIGVTVAGKVTTPDRIDHSGKGTFLEPHHTHFVLVPGTHWGDESPWLFRVADVLAARAASLTILVNGGEIAWEDVTQSVKAGHPVLVIGGSGRTADTLANALHKEATDERTKRLVNSNLLRVIDLTSDFGELTRVVEEMLSV
ncbi:MAG: hypothetical protein E6J22_19530 [Chloroflexi bacterium]|nr:MAG: hypothetical protein E6J22_19530 [Chloroflexota bacterium]